MLDVTVKTKKNLLIFFLFQRNFMINKIWKLNFNYRKGMSDVQKKALLINIMRLQSITLDMPKACDVHIGCMCVGRH